jgi:xanthine dehydrogenase accessory factor
VRTPSGLDLGPSTQEEIVLAIVAAVVAERHRVEGDAMEPPCPPAERPSEAMDPICGMTVALSSDAISAERAGALVLL